jgi:hypothetical protein
MMLELEDSGAPVASGHDVTKRVSQGKPRLSFLGPSGRMTRQTRQTHGCAFFSSAPMSDAKHVQGFTLTTNH